MRNQKGNTAYILIFAVVLILVGVGIYYFRSQKSNVVTPPVVNNTLPIPTSTPTPTNTSSGQATSGKTSPNGTYVIEEQTVGDGQTMIVKDATGKVVVADVIAKNSQSITQGLQKLGLKGSGQMGISFKNWVDDSKFVISIKTGDGSGFEATVNAVTGVIDPSSFKRTNG